MLTTVYTEGPMLPLPNPSPWSQTKRDAAGSAINVPLDADSLGAAYHWRAVLSGDSWLDPFQSSPGFGYLSLLAFAYNGGHDSHGTIGSKAYDMRGARWSMDVRANGLRLGAQVNLYFWMQFRDVRACLGKGRYVNVSYLAQTVDGLLGYTAPFERGGQQTVTSDFKRLVVDFDPTRPTEWIHMGAANSNGVDTRETATKSAPRTSGISIASSGIGIGTAASSPGTGRRCRRPGIIRMGNCRSAGCNSMSIPR